MSLSNGIIEVNQPTSDLEESPAEFDFSPISESISSVLASITELIWPTEDMGELDSSEAINAGARSTPPSLSLSASSLSLIYDIQMQAITPSNSGGAATSWSISPTLPGGLAFDSSTGEISGTPTVLSDPTDYTITATNSFGSDGVTIEISVVQQFPVIQYNPTSFTFNVASQIQDGNGDPNHPKRNSRDRYNLDSQSITPRRNKPRFIHWCHFSTPTVASSQASYQVTATNAADPWVRP